MRILKAQDAILFHSTVLSAFPEIRHAISTRIGGFSGGAFETMNLSYGRGDPDANVTRNRQKLCALAGTEFGLLTQAHQSMGSEVVRVQKDFIGNAVSGSRRPLPKCDALVTDIPGVALLTLSADCPLVLLYDPKRRVVANVHASRLGTQGEICKKTVLCMRDDFGCDPANIVACLAPSIGPCCYELGPDATSQLREKLLYAGRFLRRTNGAEHLDLWAMNRYQLVSAGVREENIETPRLCSRCNPQFFYSHRRDGAKTGRHGAILALC